MLTDYVAILDGRGRIASGSLSPHPREDADTVLPRDILLLDLIESSAGGDVARSIAPGLEDVLRGALPQFEHGYCVADGDASRTFLLRVYSLAPGKEGAVAVHLDLTEHTACTLEPKPAFACAQALMNTAEDLVFAKDVHGRYIHANVALARFLGVASPESLIGRTDADLFSSAFAHMIRADDRQVLESGRPLVQRMECIASPTSNESRWFATTKEPIRDATGRVVGLLGIARDVSERKRLEDRLRALVHTFLEFSPAPSQNIARIARLCAHLLEASGGFYRRVPDENRFEWDEIFGAGGECADAVAAAEALCAETVRQGGEIPLVVDAQALAQGMGAYAALGIHTALGQAVLLDGKPAGVLAIFFDRDYVLDEQDRELLAFCAVALANEERRDRAEREIAETKQRLDEAQRLAHIGNWGVDCPAQTIYWSDEMYRITCLPRSLPIDMDVWERCVHPEDLPVMRAALSRLYERAAPIAIDLRIVRTDREVRYCHIHAESTDGGGTKPSRVFGTMMDITDRVRADAALQAAARLESTATLASGIAHDFNNLMAAVMGNAELLQMDLRDNPEQMEMLSEVTQSARRAGELAHKMLAFAQGGKAHPRLVNLNDVVEEALSLQRAAIPQRIATEVRLSPNLWEVECDPAHLCQVVIDLCANAIESMEDEGLLSLITENVDVDAALADSVPGLHTGRYVCLSVRDTGCGMDRDTQARIFEPFFTTKFHGRGMSLAAAYGILHRYGGVMAIESRKRKGTTFRVFVPAPGVLDDSRPAKPVIPRGSETVLVVDDEPTVLAVTRKLLERLGYHVLLAENGQQAVEVARGYQEAIHLILLDMCMPVMDGATAFPLLREARPETKVLICSGFDVNRQVENLLDNGAAGFLHKPYRLDVLGPKIRELLGK